MKGRSLEEINQMFQEGVPIRKFGRYDAATALAEAEAAGNKLEGTALGLNLTKLEGGREEERIEVSVNEKIRTCGHDTVR
jgi:hypothetical protein